MQELDQRLAHLLKPISPQLQPTQVVPQYQQPVVWPGNNFFHTLVKRDTWCITESVHQLLSTSDKSIWGSGQLSRHSDVKQHEHQPANDAGHSQCRYPISILHFGQYQGTDASNSALQSLIYPRPPTTELPNVCSADRNMVAGTPGCRD